MKQRLVSPLKFISGQSISFKDVAKIISDTLNIPLQIEYIDNPYDGYQNFTQADMSKAKRLLTFEPKYNIIKGIEDYIQTCYAKK